MGIETAIIAATLLSAGATAYQVTETNKAKKEANKAAIKAEVQQGERGKELAQAEDRAEERRARGAGRAAARQQRAANRPAMGYGNQPTLLTGSLGTTAGQTAGGKTLLGS